MIEAVAKIGKMVRQERKKDNRDEAEYFVDPQVFDLVQNIYKPEVERKRAQLLIRIKLIREDSGEYKFAGIETDELKSDTCLKCLYRSLGGNALNPSPTAQITEKDTFGNKILKFFEKALEEKEIPEQTKALFNNIFIALKRSEQDIRNSIKDEISKENGTYLLTLSFVENGIDSFLLDKREFLDYFLHKIGDTESRYKGEGVCSICGSHGEVYGGVSPYRFFNTDKEGFLNNFEKSNSFKNFPICKECIRDLEEGKKFIESKLQYTFVKGIRYRLIPQDILGEESSFWNIIEILREQDSIVNSKTLTRITDDEREILELLANEEDNFSLNFLFIERQNKAEKILALIQDVLPSRLRRIYDSKRQVDKIMNDILENYESTSHNFTFATIRRFFYKSDSMKTSADLDKYFLDITDKILKGTAIDNGFLFYYLMKGIREEFVKEDSKEKSSFRFTSLDALKVVLFLNILNLLQIKEVKMEERKFDAFFKKFGSSLEDPLKKGLVLLGAATETLLEVQERERGSKPFLKYLKSLKMNEKDFKELLTKVQSKLEEYNALNEAKSLLEEASYYLLQSGDNYKINISEMNFYFAVGMNLKWEILKSLKKEA